MTKTKDWSKIIHHKPKEYKKNAVNQKACVGFDTETSNGACGLLCTSESVALESHDALEILQFLTQKPFSKTVNVFFNLGYDTNAILKLLPERNIKEIATHNETVITEPDVYKIRIIPNKFLKINNSKFFDAWQFFKYEPDSRLDTVAQKYLKTGKIDVEEITGVKKENYKFSDFSNPEIQKYCVMDALLTKQLFDVVIDNSNKVGMLCNNPYSCATLSKNYFFNTVGIKNPYWYYFNGENSKRSFEMAFNAYNGGRFEVFQKGTFNDVHEYDVNSMYPAQISKLQNIFDIDFITCKNEQAFDRLRNKQTFYAFLEIEAKQDMEINILPVVDETGVLVYPKGKVHRFITYPELQLLEKYNQEYKIIHGLIGEPKNGKVEYPFREPINNIFNERKKYDKSNFISSLYKIIMNSNYGGYIEINIDLSKDGNGNIEDMIPDDASEEFLYKSFKAGKYFCPPYASYITAMARCFLTDTMLQNDYDSILSCFTDSILGSKPLNGLELGSELGTWEYAHYDSASIVGTGLYYMQNEKKSKTRTRGFRFMGIDEFDFKKFLGNEYEITKNIKLKEAIRQDRLADFNKILKEKKEVDLNFDKKRKWNDKFNNVDDVFNKQIKSTAIEV